MLLLPSRFSRIGFESLISKIRPALGQLALGEEEAKEKKKWDKVGIMHLGLRVGLMRSLANALRAAPLLLQNSPCRPWSWRCHCACEQYLTSSKITRSNNISPKTIPLEPKLSRIDSPPNVWCNLLCTCYGNTYPEISESFGGLLLDL